MKLLQTYLSSESGAVTVEWVVLSAAVIGLILVTVIPTFTGTTGAAMTVSNAIVETISR